MPYIPSDHDKAKALDAVFYEIDQIVFLFSHLKNPSLEPALTNVYLDALLVHIRALLDFYEKTKRKQGGDDVLAGDYGFSAKSINIDKCYRDRLNKDLAHITYSRVKRTPSTKGWPLHLILFPILLRCYKFMCFMNDKFPPGIEDELKKNWLSLCNQINVLNGKEFPETFVSTKTSPL